ncbi:MAG: type II toxin-antitoxin system Phd/YefM family antitoxin [Desulfobacterales bacterium]|nr:type II toxin-antitoxin system Phd/YefM family antitoxin [Desulfobacterales bacterium]
MGAILAARWRLAFYGRKNTTCIEIQLGIKLSLNWRCKMKFLSVRDLKTKSSQVWKELPGQKEMVLTSNGRPIALLSSINENNLEQVLTAFRRARATNAVASIQYESTQKGTDKISMDEINDEIGIIRSKRKK